MILRRVSKTSGPHEIIYDLPQVQVSSIDTPEEQNYQPDSEYFALNLIVNKSRKIYFPSYRGMANCLGKII